ncbi:MAG: hypothetical protein EOP92_21520 [Lysobacteraceae bacterium]|nr:MAG: hypothetical protein EOP92_21520 [Xanthomonadaceae bacterium]
MAVHRQTTVSRIRTKGVRRWREDFIGKSIAARHPSQTGGRGDAVTRNRRFITFLLAACPMLRTMGSMSTRTHQIIRASAFCAALVLATPHASASAAAADSVPPIVTQELARQGLPLDALSYQVEPVGGKAPAYAQEAHRAVNPASAMKLVTTLAALDMLGPAHRWTTSMFSEAPPAGGALKGKLYLQGGGEPNLTWERIGAMLRTLRNSGIHAIGGDLVLDRSLFQPARPDIEAPPFDDTPDAAYNVIPDALSVSDYLVSYTLSSDASGVTVHTTPPLSGVSVMNGLVLDDRPCSAWQDTWRQPGARPSAPSTRLRMRSRRACCI